MLQEVKHFVHEAACEGSSTQIFSSSFEEPQAYGHSSTVSSVNPQVFLKGRSILRPRDAGVSLAPGRTLVHDGSTRVPVEKDLAEDVAMEAI